MKHGAELKAGDDIESTPLHFSVTSNHAEGVTVLIDTYGASIKLHMTAFARYYDKHFEFRA